MIHINLNMIFYTHVEHSPTKTIYIKYYKKYLIKKYIQTHKQAQALAFLAKSSKLWCDIQALLYLDSAPVSLIELEQ